MAKRQKAERLQRPDEAAEPLRSAPTAVAENRALEVVGRNAGERLDPRTRAIADPAFGHSFANVRVHSGPDAAGAAEAVNADAYTVGQHIVFNAGTYPPATDASRLLLAHELAHVVQNESAGRVADSGAGTPDRRSRPSDPAEAEASRAATTFVATGQADVHGDPGALIAAAPKNTATAPAGQQPAMSQEEKDAKFYEDEAKKAKQDVVQGTPDSGEKANASKQLTSQPTRAGSIEKSATGDIKTLSLDDNTRIRGGAAIKNFEASYALFRIPAALTTQSLGRVQDLLTAGGPREPGNLSKANQKALQRLDPGKNGTQLSLYMQWAQGTASLDQGMEAYLGVYQRLQGVTLQWRAMKELMVRKQLEAERKKDEAKMRKLEEPAKMIAETLEVIEAASGVYAALAPEAAEETAEEVLAIDAETDIKTKSQKAVGETVAPTGAREEKRLGRAKEFGEAAAKAGGAKFSKEAVINFIIGRSDEIAALDEHIAKLTKAIADADEKAEDFQIEGAFRVLRGTSREQITAAVAVRSQRKMARFAAGTFAGNVSHGNMQLNLAPLCAAAYQELSIFGDKAWRAYLSMQPGMAHVKGILDGDEAMRNMNYAAHENAADQQAWEAGELRQHTRGLGDGLLDIREAVKTVDNFAADYGPQVEGWVDRAGKWSKFFESRTGLSLDVYGDEAAKMQPGG